MKTSISFALILGFMAGLTSFVSVAEAVSTFGAERPVEQAYGDQLYAGVGRVELPGPVGNYCSAFLISRTWALTAAHCLENGKPNNFSFEFNSGTNFEFTTLIDETHVAEGYKPEGDIRPNDWALIHLVTPAPELYRSYRIGKANEIRVGAPAISIGYPLRADPGGSTRIIGRNCSIRRLTGDQVYSDCDMTVGNSGGPLLEILPSGEYVVAGIASTQTLNAEGGPIMWGTYSDSAANHWTSTSVHLAEFVEAVSRTK